MLLSVRKISSIRSAATPARGKYQAELEAEARYAKLAARAGGQACMFEALARDEGRHAKMIYCILQQTL